MELKKQRKSTIPTFQFNTSTTSATTPTSTISDSVPSVSSTELPKTDSTVSTPVTSSISDQTSTPPSTELSKADSTTITSATSSDTSANATKSTESMDSSELITTTSTLNNSATSPVSTIELTKSDLSQSKVEEKDSISELSNLTPATLIQYMQSKARSATQETPKKSSEFVFGSTESSQSQWNASAQNYFGIESQSQSNGLSKQKIKSPDSIITFTKEEREMLIKLPNKEYIINNEKSVLLGLLDIMLAYSYNHRTTMGENTVESAWTICKLSPTLSWLENFSSIKEVVVAFVRRSLAYPLYRHWKLSMKVIEDTACLFRLGKRAVLKALLDVKNVLEHSESFFHLYRLYVEDYCVWIQSVGKKKLRSLSRELGKHGVKKEDIGWNLETLELEAALQNTDIQDDQS